MPRELSYAAPLVGLALLSPVSLDATARYAVLKAPSSIRPEAKSAPVRVSHHHRAIVECVHVPKPVSCVGRVAEADTAAVVRFEPAGVLKAALDSARSQMRVVLPHRAGPQEQGIDLPVGEWLVDWLDSEKLARLNVEPESRIQVALATTSGACELKAGRCELVTGVRERHIRVSSNR